MHWKLIAQKPFRLFYLTDDDKKLMALSFSHGSHMFRVESNRERRKFFIDRSAVSKRHLTLRNEYGFIYARAINSRSSPQKGVIEIDGDKLSYAALDKQEGVMVFSREDKGRQFVICSIKSFHAEKKDGLQMQAQFESDCFLFASAWYLRMAIKKANAGL
jgi:hypothetical protein